MKSFFIVFLLLVLAAFTSGCPRKDQPPQISIICTLDGFGGGDCALPDGTKVYKSPSEMKGFWATTQTDEANFAAWCFKVPPKVANARFERIKAHLVAERAPLDEFRLNADPAPEMILEQRGDHEE